MRLPLAGLIGHAVALGLVESECVHPEPGHLVYDWPSPLTGRIVYGPWVRLHIGFTSHGRNGRYSRPVVHVAGGHPHAAGRHAHAAAAVWLTDAVKALS